MPRYTNEELVTFYMRDLEIEIESNAREAAAGRTDLQDYDLECRAELAKLQEARAVGKVIAIDAYGIPKILDL